MIPEVDRVAGSQVTSTSGPLTPLERAVAILRARAVIDWTEAERLAQESGEVVAVVPEHEVGLRALTVLAMQYCVDQGQCFSYWLQMNDWLDSLDLWDPDREKVIFNYLEAAFEFHQRLLAWLSFWAELGLEQHQILRLYHGIEYVDAIAEEIVPAALTREDALELWGESGLGLESTQETHPGGSRFIVRTLEQYRDDLNQDLQDILKLWQP